MKKINTLVTLLILFLFGTANAQDFADVINQSSRATADHRVIYEMNVGAFTQEGTFNAARQRLGELKTLGVDVVWLMPIYPRGGGINSPYAARNFQQTNPAYGSIADLRNFVSRAHELNMLVWLDWVPNHTATNADWVTQHPDYYSWNGGQMVHPNGYGDVYELNYGNQALQNAMNDCLRFWVDQVDVDGYRCDYVASPTIPNTYWQNAISQLRNYRNKNIEFLAESNLTWDHYLDNVNVGFSYDYAWSFQTDLVNIGWGTSASALQNAANTLIGASKYNFSRMLYITNHDQNWNEGNKTLSAKYGSNKYLFTVFYYTLYGMPLLYNGQEIGGDQPLNYFSDEKVNWNNTDYKMRNTVRTLNALKHNEAALGDRVGVNWLNTNNGNVLAYTRKQGNSEVLVILNLGDNQATVNISGLNAGTWSQWINSDNITQGVNKTQQNINSTHSFTLSGKGYSVFVRDGNSSGGGSASSNTYIPYLENSNEVSIFFETRNPTNYNVWAWDSRNDGGIFIKNGWPGDAMELKGQNNSGAYIYKITFSKTNDIPAYLIISKDNGSTKIYDGVTFTNHGYYIEGNNGSNYTVTTVGNPQANAPVITPYMMDGSGWHQQTNMTINVGTTFALGPQANGNAWTTGTWSWTGPNGFTSNNREITIVNASAAQGGNYTATFTDINGAKASSTMTVNINNVKAPVITPYVLDNYGWRSLTELSITAGENFSLGPQANQDGSWYWTGPNGFTSNNREITIWNATTAQDGTYTVTFRSNNGTQTSKSIYVHVWALSNLNIIPYVHNGAGWSQATDVTVNAGGRFSMGPQERNGYDNGNATWRWTGPNGFTANTREFTINNVTSAQAGKYTLTFTDQYGRRAVRDFHTYVNGSNRAMAAALTGIDEIETTKEEDKATIYNLQGVKVDNPTKRGIYIVNGRKVILGN